MNKIINSLLNQIKDNFEQKNRNLKIEKPEEYNQKLEKHIFSMFMFIASILTLFAIFITFFIMQFLT